jgi:two-component system cell cycle response regulator
VDTDPYQKDNIQQILKAANITISSVPTIVEATALINQKSFDLLICSIDLGDEDGLLLCSLLRAQPVTRQLPILLMAQEGDMARIAKGLDLGANDYIMRPIDANELLARARTQLKQKKHYEQIRKNYEESFMMALIDPLTGAYNRRYLDAHLPRLLERLVPSEKPLSILMIDIDHFKIINDTHGHAIGDAVLKEVVARIMNGLRPSDLVVRMGGEEFAVVLPETSLERGKSVAERIRARVEATPTGANANGDVVRTTISIGISCVPMGVEEPAESLLNRADKALYEAKHTGRNKVVSAK